MHAWGALAIVSIIGSLILWTTQYDNNTTDSGYPLWFFKSPLPLDCKSKLDATNLKYLLFGYQT